MMGGAVCVNQYESLREQKRGHFTLWILIAVLFALEVCSVSVLFSQMTSFSPVQKRNYISLTEASDITTLEIGQRNNDGSLPIPDPAANKANHAPHSIRPFVVYDENSDKVGFWTYDENTVWSTHTDIEIFRLQHDNNGDGVFTVITSDGDKVFAPGTENDYSYTLRNTNSVALDYIMTVEAYVVVPDGIWLPIQGRLYSHYDGKYLCGSDEEWPDVLELDGISEQGVIGAGNIKDYTLQWRWPFERGEVIQEGLYKGDYTEDFYDTMLGNLAVDEDLELHIIIRTSAWLDENPDNGGGNPVTGDTNNPTFWLVIAGLTLVAIAVMAFFLLRDRKKQNCDEN